LSSSTNSNVWVSRLTPAGVAALLRAGQFPSRLAIGEPHQPARAGGAKRRDVDVLSCQRAGQLAGADTSVPSRIHQAGQG